MQNEWTNFIELFLSREGKHYVEDACYKLRLLAIRQLLQKIWAIG